MKQGNRLLWLAAFVCLAIPLMFVGTASARFMADGAFPDGAGGFKVTEDMVCIVGVHADGTLDIADNVTSRRDCIYLNKGTMNGGTPFDLTGMTTSAACINAGGAGNDGAKHSFATSVCVDGTGKGLSLTGLDRTMSMCVAKGGTWKQTSATPPYPGAPGTYPTPGFTGLCVANGAQFTGVDSTGAKKPFGTKGTDSSTVTDMGFCYTSMRWESVPGFSAAECPSLKSTTAPFDADAAYDWSVSGTQCRYSKSVAGTLTNALTKADGTTYAAGTYQDLGTYTTMGDCLANGGSWNNWVGKAPYAAFGNGTGGTYKRLDWNYQAQVPDADEGCLHCHSTKVEYNGPAERFKDSYLKTGHKNMLRKVTAGQPWAGPDGVVYSAYAAGTINFNNATAQVSGVDKPLLYIFGDWMAPAPGGLDVIVDMGATGAKYNGTSNYSCAPCHSTGWNNLDLAADGNPNGICSLSSKTTQTLCTGAGGTWYPTIGVKGIGKAGFNPVEPHASFPSVTFTGAGNWDLEGIQCGRCHNAAVGPVTAGMIAASQYPTTYPTGGGMGNIPGGPAAFSYSTQLCYGCHQSIAKAANGTSLDADLTSAVKIPVKNNKTAPLYQPEFNSHVLGGSFLNSPHARYTGAIQPNSMGKYDLSAGGTYSSAFKGFTCWQSSTSTSPAKTQIIAGETHEIKDKATCESLYGAGAWRAETQGGCSSCHDVHQSLFVEGQEALRKECTSCHQNAVYAAAVPVTAQISNIYHPESALTPVGIANSEGDPAVACEICHMPKATSGGFPMHLWRISTDPNYRTFPTAAEFGIPGPATKKVANTAPDGAYANATWVDVDYACGQCHGGGTLANPTYADADRIVAGAMPYPKTTLAAFAVSIHQNIAMPAASFTFSYDPAVSYKVDFDAAGSTCPATAAPCTYAWDFTNDGSNDASGVTATNTYANATAQVAKLSVTDKFLRTVTQVKNVYPQPKANTPPVAAFTLAQTGPAVTVTNTSSDADGDIASAKFYLTWGDGTSEPIATGLTTFNHTYTSAGAFTITLLATDPQSAQNSASQAITVTTATYTIGGTVTAGPAGASNVNSVLLTLKKGTTVVANTYTLASGAGPFSYSFTGLAPAANYTVTAYKSGATFAETNPTAAITVGPDSLSNNFTTVKTKFSITSTAKGSGGANLSGVTITVKNSGGATVASGTTNTSGVYATTMTLPAGTYTVTAYKALRAFSNTPQSITFINGNPDGSLTFNSTTP